MSSDGSDSSYDPRDCTFDQMDPIEFMLFDSLVHRMIEKGLLTKNDALSIVQTVAQVVRNYAEDGAMGERANAALATLKRTYSSFEAIPEKPSRILSDLGNVHQLRAPLHGQRPDFECDD